MSTVSLALPQYLQVRGYSVPAAFGQPKVNSPYGYSNCIVQTRDCALSPQKPGCEMQWLNQATQQCHNGRAAGALAVGSAAEL